MTPADAELIAEAVIRLMEERKPYSGVLVSPEQLAEYLNVSRDYCYRHAAELGARKVGNLLRFSIPEVDERLRMAQPGHSDATSCSTGRESAAGSPAPGQVRRRRRRRTAHTPAAPAQTGEHHQG
jgi:excisionase family DNA binding protein